MRESTTMQELAVTIRTDESLLTLTPRGLLEYYLPGAEQVKPGVWKGKSATGKDVYVQTEVLAGALMDCKEKQLNPISEIYLITSNAPDRKASHKIKYTVGLERMREMPGFLGLKSGLILLKGEEEKRTQGRALYPGWTLFGAWAKAFFEGVPEPLEHEVDFESCVVENSPNWQSRPSFMILKVVEDELWRLKVLPRMKPKQREEIDGEAIILEGRPLREIPTREQPQATAGKKDQKPQPVWNAGELYTGTIQEITAAGTKKVKGKEEQFPGIVTLLCPDQSKLTCLFWTPPPVLKDHGEWAALFGKEAVISFRVKKNDQGTIFRFIDTLDIATAPTTETGAGAVPPDEEPLDVGPEPPPAAHPHEQAVKSPDSWKPS